VRAPPRQHDERSFVAERASSLLRSGVAAPASPTSSAQYRSMMRQLCNHTLYQNTMTSEHYHVHVNASVMVNSYIAIE